MKPRKAYSKRSGSVYEQPNNFAQSLNPELQAAAYTSLHLINNVKEQFRRAFPGAVGALCPGDGGGLYGPPPELSNPFLK